MLLRRLLAGELVPHDGPVYPLRDALVAQEIYTTARRLYDALRLDRARIRLVGVRVEGLLDAASVARQLALDDRPQGRREAEQAMDKAAARFGSGVVRPASLVDESDDDR
jgi:DNA polymerase-4